MRMMSHAETRRSRRMDVIKCHRERSAAIPCGNGVYFPLPEITTSACGLLVMTMNRNIFLPGYTWRCQKGRKRFRAGGK